MNTFGAWLYIPAVWVDQHFNGVYYFLQFGVVERGCQFNYEMADTAADCCNEAIL